MGVNMVPPFAPIPRANCCVSAISRGHTQQLKAEVAATRQQNASLQREVEKLRTAAATQRRSSSDELADVQAQLERATSRCQQLEQDLRAARDATAAVELRHNEAQEQADSQVRCAATGVGRGGTRLGTTVWAAASHHHLTRRAWFWFVQHSYVSARWVPRPWPR